MNVKSPLNLPGTIITHLEQLAEYALQERIELGLYVPEVFPDIELVIGLNDHKTYLPDINSIYLDLRDLLGAKKYTYASEFRVFREFLDTRSLLGLPLEELIYAFITENHGEILEEMSERAGKKSGMYYGLPDRISRRRFITASEKVEEISPYILRGEHKRDFEKLLDLITDSISQVQGADAPAFVIYNRPDQKPYNSSERSPHLLTNLRHSLDHAAFYNSTLGHAAMGLYNKIDSRTESKKSVDPDLLSEVVPEYQAEEFQMLIAIAEAGASFFNLVPYGRWELEKSNVEEFTSQAIRYIVGSTTLNHLYNVHKYFGLVLSFSDKKKENIINTFVDAHIKDPSRLGRAYHEALTSQEFMSIAKCG